jgi:hypothetical protein
VGCRNLVVFTAVGVALPLWVMSPGPKGLAAVQWAFWPFALALALLVGYIVLYLAQLTGRRQSQ